ncbi:sugar ABC transporter [Sorangium cellulosum]|uniref:Sugar ABC transporter n=1 Tax=Sorangium cellulosum TaxID=56 RepID=A0A2L0EZ59_SORCE|nr:substrate-binding domain-containing protein [Sorangium cellulosum]AUX44565.1 sugar ABC transporter [Sorangium cellulosum]
MTRIARWGTTAFGLMLMTAACGSSQSHEGEDATPIQRIPVPQSEFIPEELEATVDRLIAEINESSPDPMQMTVVLKAAVGFWQPVVKAANRAMGELGATGNVLGSLTPSGDTEEAEQNQIRQIEQAVADGAKGIGVAAFDDSQTAAVDEAIAKGVHVVTLDTDVPTSKRAIYVGTLDKASGITAAKTLLAMLPAPPGTVIIHGNTDPEWSNGMDRTQGAQSVFEEAGYSVLVRDSSWHSTSEAEDIAWMTDQLDAAEPPAVGMIGLFDISYRCAMAAEAAGKDLPIVTFDFNPTTVDYMRKGLIKATHTQRQYYQGYLVPYILYGIENLGLDATKEILAPQMVDDNRVNTGLDVVPADKIDAYNDFLDVIGSNQ